MLAATNNMDDSSSFLNLNIDFWSADVVKKNPFTEYETRAATQYYYWVSKRQSVLKMCNSVQTNHSKILIKASISLGMEDKLQHIFLHNI